MSIVQPNSLFKIVISNIINQRHLLYYYSIVDFETAIAI